MWRRVPVLTGSSTGGDDRYYHLVLLAENNTGYANLMQNRHPEVLWRGTIISRVWIWRFWRNYHEGIIALSACLAGEVPRYLTREDCTEEAKRCALKYQSIFGKDNYFPGTAGSWDSGAADRKHGAFTDVAENWTFRWCATNDVHYTYAEDAEAPRYPSVYPDRQKAFR